jgi:hypothetical protein
MTIPFRILVLRILFFVFRLALFHLFLLPVVAPISVASHSLHGMSGGSFYFRNCSMSFPSRSYTLSFNFIRYLVLFLSFHSFSFTLLSSKQPPHPVMLI